MSWEREEDRLKCCAKGKSSTDGMTWAEGCCAFWVGDFIWWGFFFVLNLLK